MYTVIEMQDTGEVVVVASFGYMTEAEANKKYYEILYNAVSSDIPLHSAHMFYDAMYMKGDALRHGEMVEDVNVEIEEPDE